MIVLNNTILALDAGLSSLEFAIYDACGGSVSLVSKGRFDNTACFEAQDPDGQTIARELSRPREASLDYEYAVEYLLHWLGEKHARQRALIAVGHRMTHGGPDFAGPELIAGKTLWKLEQLESLAPRQSCNLAVVRAIAKLRPGLPQIACFDTGFHWGRPAAAERYALPGSFSRLGLKRWGFHGLAYESVMTSLEKAAPDLARGRVIVAHIGEEAGLCAIRGGRCVETTPGFSSLDGLPMGTNCGSLDPGAVLHLLRQISVQEVEDLLQRQSGLLGISGISGDLQVLLASNDARAADAVQFFVYRVIREIGSLAAAMGGLDALVFAGEAGVNSAALRGRICQGLAWLGVALDGSANERHRRCVSSPERAPSVWVVPADVPRVIAGHVARIVSLMPNPVSHWKEAGDARALRMVWSGRGKRSAAL